MRILILLSCVCLMAACVTRERAGGTSGGQDVDIAAAGERTSDEYDIVEGLRENPIDLCTASTEDLLSIPGFPVDLACRVVDVRGERRSGVRWLEGLTPPERESLRRFGGCLILPDRAPVRFSLRASTDRFEPSPCGRTDCYCSVSGDGWRLTTRGRLSGDQWAQSFYCSCRAMAGVLRLHGGDFQPDCAFGLLFSGCSSSYPFSGGYPLRPYRWIIGRTSLFASSMRGLACEAWIGGSRIMLFAAKERFYKSGRFLFSERATGGSRVEVKAGECSFGSTVGFGPSFPGRCVAASDFRLVTGGVTVSGEIARSGESRWAAVFGTSYRGARLELGSLLYGIPYGFETRYGGIFGKSSNGDTMVRGCSIVAQCRIFGRTSLRTAVERSLAGHGKRVLYKDTVRMEIEHRRRKTVCSLTCKSRLGRECVVIPFPGGERVELSSSQDLRALITWEHRHRFRLRFSAQYPWGDGYSGWAVSPSVRCEIVPGTLRLTLCSTVYRSLHSTAAFYVYEPILEGGYPWKTLRGSGSRGVAHLAASYRGLSVSSLLSADRGGAAAIAVQISADF